VIQKSTHQFSIAFFLLFMLSPLVFSEELELNDETIKQLKNVLKIEFAVNLIQPGENDVKKVWDSKKIKYTIPGYTVVLKVEGTNLKFIGNFTPYIKRDGSLLLIAQGQVVLNEPSKKILTYFTCFKSMSLSFGEKIVFLPLGITEGDDKKKAHNIEIEIQIFPYSDTEEETQD
jgi:hypothetical protein